MKVWVNGTFDVLHVGHLKLLEYSASLGELRVGIDSDKRVKELKGADRPFNTTEDRKYFLECLKFVNEVVVFDSRQELNDGSGVPFSDVKIVYGSEHAKNLVFFEKVPKYSTTKILNYENNSDR